MAVGWAADGRAALHRLGDGRRPPLAPDPRPRGRPGRAAGRDRVAGGRPDGHRPGRLSARPRGVAGPIHRLSGAYGSFDPVLGPVLTEAEWHDQRARDAEEEGDGPTARYHLDRRLAAVPGDGAAVVRRMHRRADSGRRLGGRGRRPPAGPGLARARRRRSLVPALRVGLSPRWEGGRRTLVRGPTGGPVTGPPGLPGERPNSVPFEPGAGDVDRPGARLGSAIAGTSTGGRWRACGGSAPGGRGLTTAAETAPAANDFPGQPLQLFRRQAFWEVGHGRGGLI